MPGDVKHPQCDLLHDGVASQGTSDAADDAPYHGPDGSGQGPEGGDTVAAPRAAQDAAGGVEEVLGAALAGDLAAPPALDVPESDHIIISNLQKLTRI